jgi:hypothetical protein
MVCPNCNSSNLKRVSLIHAAGVYESRGRFRGLLFGGTDGALFGRYRGTSQSRLSALSNPPARAPYRWTDHFMANRILHPDVFRWTRKLSWEMAVLSVAYLFLLPAYLLASLFYNFFVRPAKHRRWKEKFMCQRCGTISVP